MIEENDDNVTPIRKYLGKTEVDVFAHPKYGHYTQTDWAMLYIEMYGGIDGDHHQKWLVDQVARILKGTLVDVSLASWSDGYTEYRFNTSKPSTEYLEWVEEMLGDTDENGDREYDYDYGIAP